MHNDCFYNIFMLINGNHIEFNCDIIPIFENLCAWVFCLFCTLIIKFPDMFLCPICVSLNNKGMRNSYLNKLAFKNYSFYFKMSREIYVFKKMWLVIPSQKFQTFYLFLSNFLIIPISAINHAFMTVIWQYCYKIFLLNPLGAWQNPVTEWTSTLWRNDHLLWRNNISSIMTLPVEIYLWILLVQFCTQA